MKAIRNGSPNGLALARKGFTLLELIVVITIIGILGTLVVVRVAGVGGQARITKIKYDIHAIAEAAEMMYAQTGRYPQTLEEVKSGNPGGAGSADQKASITVEKTKDPWNNEYIYELDSSGKPHVRCLGRDGAQGGEGDDLDYEYPDAEGA